MENLCNVRDYLLSNSYPTGCVGNQKRFIRKQSKGYELKDGKLHKVKTTRKGDKISVLVIFDDEEQLNILKECHDDNGHKGVTSVINTIGARYFWPKWTNQVKEYCLSCERCQQSNISIKARPAAELHPIPVISDLWKQWGIDYIGPFQETKRGNKYIIAATDYFSKFPEAMAVPKNDAQTTARFLFGLYCRYGSASIIISDRGSHFCNKVMEEMNKHFGVKHKVATPYHPQTNGLQERTNQTIEKSLQKLVQDADSWDLQLDPALFGIRQAISRTTKYSPFQIAYGRPPTLPAEMKLKEMETPKEATEEIVENFMKYRKTLHDMVEENIKDAQTKMKEDHGRKVAAKNSFAPGDIVYRRNCRKLQRKQSKLKELNWIGPYTISEVSSKGVATLMDRSGTVLKLKCSVGNLKLKRRRPRHLMDRVKKPSPVMTASTKETQEIEHQSDSEVSFKTVQREGEPNEDEASTRSSSPLLSDRTLQGVGGRLKEFFDAGHLAAIQTSVTSKALPKITSPLQIPECHADPRLSLIANTHDENEDLYDHVFKILLAEVKTEDIHTKLCSAMLATAVVVSSYISGMLLHETMETINEVPNHLEKVSLRPFPKLPASKKLVIGSNSITGKDLHCLDGQNWLDDSIIHAYLGLLQRERTLLQKNEVFILPCFLMEKWTRRDYLSWLYPKVKFSSYAFILMPICSNHHWILLVASVSKKTVSVLDPLGHQHPDIEHKWRKYMYTREKYIPEGLEKWTSDHQAVSRQRDGNSCGVFVLMYAEAILCNVNVQIMRQCHVARYRRYIKQRLMDGTTEEDDVCQIPFCRKPKSGIWTQCQDCSIWVHLQCSNNNRRKVSKEDHICLLCVWREECKLGC